MRKEPPRILVVEDEPDVCSYIQSYLGRRGYMISTTSSGKEAMSMIEIIKPQVVILDFSINDLDGREVLKRLRKNDKDTKVIVVTGQQFPDEEVERICSLGVSEYLVKPLMLDKLALVIQQVIGGDFTASDATGLPVVDAVPARGSMPRAGGVPKGRPLTPKIVLPKKVSKRKKQVSSGTIVHKLFNLLGIIRNKCENFNSNIEDGIYKAKSNKELVNMSVDIMSEIIDTVDRASEVVDTIKEKSKR